MATRTERKFEFDIGANHLCNLYVEIKKYCKTFNIHFRPMKFLNYKIFRKGKARSIYKAVNPFTGMRLNWRLFASGKAGKGTDFFNLSTATKFDHTNAYDFIKRKSGKTIANYLADPFASTYQFHRAKEISLGVMISVLSSIKTSLTEWELHNTKGGMSALPEAFAKRLNVKLKTPIQKVHVKKEGKIEVTTTTTEIFDAVVMASTATITKKLYKNPTEAQQKVLTGSDYSTSISLAFEIDADKLDQTSIIWVPHIESTKISGITNELMKGKDFIKHGKSLICAWVHEDYAKKIIKKSDKEIFELIKKELVKYTPWTNDAKDLTNYDIHRWNEAMPKFRPGHLTKVADFIKNGQGDKNVFFCGDFLNSPWTEGALRCGQRVAKRIVKKLK